MFVLAKTGLHVSHQSRNGVVFARRDDLLAAGAASEDLDQMALTALKSEWCRMRCIDVLKKSHVNVHEGKLLLGAVIATSTLVKEVR